MSFRRRITFASAAAVAVAVLLASVLVYVLTCGQLHGQMDTQLRARSDNLRLIERHPSHRHDDRLLGALASRGVSAQQLLESGPQQPGEALGNVSPRPNQVRGYQQLVDAHGTVLFRSGAKNVTLPVDSRTRALAAGNGESFFRDATVNGSSCASSPSTSRPGRAVQFAQPLNEVNELLDHLRLILVLIGLGGILLAALLGQAGRARRGAARQAADTGGRACRRDTGPLPAHRPCRGRRDRAARGQLQRDARRARGLDGRTGRLGPRPAPARRRRLARAAHAGHEPAYEHRDPAAGGRHGCCRTASCCWATWSSRSRS